MTQTSNQKSEFSKVHAAIIKLLEVRTLDAMVEGYSDELQSKYSRDWAEILNTHGWTPEEYAAKVLSVFGDD